MPIEWPDWTRQPGAERVFYRECPECGATTARLGFSYHRCGPRRGLPFNPTSASAQQPATNRTASASETERERAFVDLSPYRDGVITLGKFSGSSQWERHPSGDENVQVVAGEIVLRIDGGSLKLAPGEMAVVPANRWHQIYAREMASVLYITPLPTEHFKGGDPTNRQFDPLAGRGKRLLAALAWLWFWLRGDRDA